MCLCDQCYITPSSNGDAPSVTEFNGLKSVNLDGNRCSRHGYLHAGVANSGCDVVSMGECGVVAVASSASSLSS